jgi:hypothetical protein
MISNKCIFSDPSDWPVPIQVRELIEYFNIDVLLDHQRSCTFATGFWEHVQLLLFLGIRLLINHVKQSVNLGSILHQKYLLLVLEILY